MQFPRPKSAIMISGAAILVIVPTVMVIAGKPAKSIANGPVAIRPLSPAANAESAAHRVARLLLANPTATPSATPAPLPTTTAAPTTAGQPAVHHPTPAPPPPPPPPAPAPLGVPAFSHVFVIAMENQEYSSVIGSGAAPYINSLAASYA